MVKTVKDDSFDHVAAEEVYMLYRCGGYKIKIIRIEVRFDGHDISHMLPRV